MFDKEQPIHIKELMWLAHYYQVHGQVEKAEQIRDAILGHDDGHEHFFEWKPEVDRRQHGENQKSIAS